MLYLGIDQHARQITTALRDDSGDVLQGQEAWPTIGDSHRDAAAAEKTNSDWEESPKPAAIWHAGYWPRLHTKHCAKTQDSKRGTNASDTVRSRLKAPVIRLPTSERCLTSTAPYRTVPALRVSTRAPTHGPVTSSFVVDITPLPHATWPTREIEYLESR